MNIEYLIINVVYFLISYKKKSYMGLKKSLITLVVQVKAYILRILANEIYTWKGKVTPELSKVSDVVKA